MSDWNQNQDPLEFVRGIWGNMGFNLPGMVTPTLDTDELGKRIDDLKAVEGWLRMNLSMLQMTIQNLEMQRTTLSAVKTMSQMAKDATAGEGGEAGTAALSQAAMWPWNLMQQMQEQVFAQNPQAPGKTGGSEGEAPGKDAKAAAGKTRRKTS